MTEINKAELIEKAEKLKEEVQNLTEKEIHYLVFYLMGYFDPSISTEDKLNSVDYFWTALNHALESWRDVK